MNNDNEELVHSYSRTNKYHIVNGITIPFSHLDVYINYRNSVYEIEFIRWANDCMCDFYQVYCDSVNTLWKIVKPDTNTIVIRRMDYGIASALQITYDTAEMRYRFNTSASMLSIIHDKLHESETNFRHGLMSPEQTDCKIDFF
jgi:hypothetical protein